MTKLEKLYNSIESLKELGLKLDAKLLEETSRLEEEIIKNDVIPLLEEQIRPHLSQIKRELVLEIDYIPDEPITVNITRKRSFSSLEATSKPQTKEQTISTHRTFSISPHHKSHKTVLSVKFPDGKVISEHLALQTLVKCIQIIGFEKVQALGIICSGVPLVSNKKDDFYNQEEIKNGLYIMTHSNTQTKKQQLDEISKRLKLGLNVEIV